jgi:signal transduction histidine kinase
MNDKERLELIKKSVQNLLSLADSEGIGEVDITEVYEDMSWLIEKAEKEEYWRKQHRKRADELEDAYFKIQLLENKLQQAQAKIEHHEKELKSIEQNSFEVFGAARIAKHALEGGT